MTNPIDRLTPRQRELARELAGPKTAKQIAFDRFIAPGTLTHHVMKISRKLGVANRAQIAYLVGRHDAAQEQS